MIESSFGGFELSLSSIEKITDTLIEETDADPADVVTALLSNALSISNRTSRAPFVVERMKEVLDDINQLNIALN